MRELPFAYEMKLEFSAPVRNHRFTLKCLPRSDARQEILEQSVEVWPREFLAAGEDSFGNGYLYGCAKSGHDRFLVTVKGRARTGLRAAQPAPEAYRIGFYRCQTAYTEPGETLLAFAREIHKTRSWEAAASGSAALRARCLLDALYAHFTYEQGVTDVSTTAEQAFVQGRGVCQDYAHILLSLCRMEGIPCRYVVGMLLGEGLSHAWVEVWDNGFWIALDPTNPAAADEEHIKISAGRDYRDCRISHGIFVGQAAQHQEIRVRVGEGAGAAPD